VQKMSQENEQKSLENLVVIQGWEESERGWGCRPDGGTLHLTITDCQIFIKQYQDKMPTNYIPDEYSHLRGTPHMARVDNGLYQEIQESRNGIWLSQVRLRDYERSGRLYDLSVRKRGWVPMSLIK